MRDLANGTSVSRHEGVPEQPRETWLGRGSKQTFCLFEDALDSAGAPRAGHCDVELVMVGCFSHDVGFG